MRLTRRALLILILWCCCAAGVLAARADGGNALHVLGHAGVNVEIEKERLPAAREGALRAREDHVLGFLAHLLGCHVFEVGRVEHVYIAHPERTGVVGLHRGEECVEVAGERAGVLGGGGLGVEVLQLEAVLLQILEGMR